MEGYISHFKSKFDAVKSKIGVFMNLSGAEQHRWYLCVSKKCQRCNVTLHLVLRWCGSFLCNKNLLFSCFGAIRSFLNNKKVPDNSVGPLDPPQTPHPPNFSQKPKFDLFFFKPSLTRLLLTQGLTQLAPDACV